VILRIEERWAAAMMAGEERTGRGEGLHEFVKRVREPSEEPQERTWATGGLTGRGREGVT
jgi:hypothetical protein